MVHLMRDRRLYLAPLAVICAYLMMFSCRPVTPDDGINPRTRVPENNAALRNVIVSGDTVRLVYAPGAAKPNYTAGDVIVGRHGDGYLKKVVSSSVRGDTLVLRTSQAAFTDAVDSCTFDTTVALVAETMTLPAIKRDSEYTDAAGVMHKVSVSCDGLEVLPTSDGRTFVVRLPNVRVEISNGGNLAAFVACDTVVLTKGIDIDLGLRVRGAAVSEFRAIAQSTEGVSFRHLRLGFTRTLYNDTAQVKLATVRLGHAVVMVGFVPVVFAFEMGVYVGIGANLSLTVSGEIANEASVSSSLTVGAIYENRAYRTVYDKTLSSSLTMSFVPVGVSAELQSFLRGSLDMKIYGVAGPTVYAQPYIYDEISSPPISVEAGYGISAGLGFKAEILDRRIVEFNWTFADFRRALVDTTFAANQPPTTPTTPSGTSSGQVNVSYTYSSSTTDPEGGRVALRFDWGNGDTSNWTAYVNSGVVASQPHAWSAAGTYSIRAQAKDEAGNLSGWSSARTVYIGVQ